MVMAHLPYKKDSNATLALSTYCTVHKLMIKLYNYK